MKKEIKTLLIIIDVALILITAFWYYNGKGIDALVAFLTTVAGLITLLATKSKTPPPSDTISGKQTQSSGNNSTNYQAGRDVNVNTKP